MAEDVFDAIVIGAGVAGSTAAYVLAKAGLQVILVERGPYPGSKNLSGGILYGSVLRQIIPDFADQAPLERCITNHIVSFLTADSQVNLDYKSTSLAAGSCNGFTVLRAKFDRWLAGKAEEAGAILVPGIKVERVIRSEGKVTGIEAGEESMLASVVIAADGANSFIAQEAGLRGRLATGQLALGVKEVIGLPKETIEDRFHLSGNEGTAYSIVGSITDNVPGGGFLYTNRDSISAGLVLQTADLINNRSQPAQIFEQFLEHPMIAPLVKGGQVLEYGAHLIPEGGAAAIPLLYSDGLLLVGDAAGLGVNNGFVVRGMDLAIGSAICAAETVIEAKARSDYSSASLSAYEQKMEHSFVMADMNLHARAPGFFNNEHLYREYPELAASLFHKIYTQQAEPKKHILSYAMESARESGLSMFEIARFLVEGVRAL